MALIPKASTAVEIILDKGSSVNLICIELARKLRLVVDQTQRLHVRSANNQESRPLKFARGVEVEIHGVTSLEDLVLSQTSFIATSAGREARPCHVLGGPV